LYFWGQNFVADMVHIHNMCVLSPTAQSRPPSRAVINLISAHINHAQICYAKSFVNAAAYRAHVHWMRISYFNKSCVWMQGNKCEWCAFVILIRSYLLFSHNICICASLFCVLLMRARLYLSLLVEWRASAVIFWMVKHIGAQIINEQ